MIVSMIVSMIVDMIFNMTVNDLKPTQLTMVQLYT